MLGRPDAAVQTIQDVELRLGDRRRLHEPPEQRSRFVVAVQLEQRVDEEARIANPTEAVVPIALAADFLRQRGRRRRHGCARRREDERLEHEGAARHRIAPGTVVAASGDPRLPERDRVREPCLQRLTRRKHERFGIRRREREQRTRAALQFEVGAHRVVVLGGGAGIPARHRNCAGRRDRPAVARVPPRRRRGVVEPRREMPAHRHRAGEPFERPHDLAHRLEASVRQRQRVDHPHRSARGRKGGFEHVRVRHVSARAVEWNRRLNDERAAARGVEDRREHARRVHVREAQPIDGAVARHERGGPAVANQRVVFDRSVTVDAHEPARTNAVGMP